MKAAENYYCDHFDIKPENLKDDDRFYIEFMESYTKQQITNAICDYVMDKSDKAHINTVEDWVEDWLNQQTKP